MIDERVLGVVGGIGPESSLDYYRRLVDGWHALVGPDSHPRVLLDSVDGGPIVGPMIAGDLGPVRDVIGRAVAALAAGGAGLALIASVASHSVFDEVAASAPIPMLSIVDAVLRAARNSGVTRPAVFGTLVATEGRFFSRPFEAAGIELVRPSADDRRWIHDVYLGELVRGRFLDSTRDHLRLILAGLRDREGVDGLILAGTELSLILPDPECDGVPVLNAAAIHVADALRWLAGGTGAGPG